VNCTWPPLKVAMPYCRSWLAESMAAAVMTRSTESAATPARRSRIVSRIAGGCSVAWATMAPVPGTMPRIP
jgi:hypothetical protein